MARKGSLNGNIVMSALSWLGRTPESFVPGHPEAASRQPFPGESGHGRWNFQALHAAVDAQRIERQMTGAQVAKEIRISSSSISTLALGGMVGFPRVMRITSWLGRPAADFVSRMGP
jgi:hypothetical protein